MTSRQREEVRGEESTYVRIVPPHDVSDDDRSIFKFQLWQTEQNKSVSLNLILNKSLNNTHSSVFGFHIV